MWVDVCILKLYNRSQFEVALRALVYFLAVYEYLHCPKMPLNNLLRFLSRNSPRAHVFAPHQYLIESTLLIDV